MVGGSVLKLVDGRLQGYSSSAGYRKLKQALGMRGANTCGACASLLQGTANYHWAVATGGVPWGFPAPSPESMYNSVILIGLLSKHFQLWLLDFKNVSCVVSTSLSSSGQSLFLSSPYWCDSHAAVVNSSYNPL